MAFFSQNAVDKMTHIFGSKMVTHSWLLMTTLAHVDFAQLSRTPSLRQYQAVARIHSYKGVFKPKLVQLISMLI